MSMTAEREMLDAEYAEKVRGYVFGKLSNKADVEDVVSEVFLKVCEKYQTFDADRASAATWVYTITRNTVIDYFRAHRICAELPEDADRPAVLQEDVPEGHGGAAGSLLCLCQGAA